MLKSMTFRSTLAAVACAISISAHAMADPAKQIDVPAGDLIPALESLEKQAAIELVFQPDQLKFFHTRGVKGTYRPDAAVRILLKGTPLELRTDPTGAMVIAPPHTLSALEQREEARASGKGGDSKGGQPPPASSLQLAQSTQGTNPTASSPSQGGKKKDSTVTADESSKQGVKLEEVLVTARKRVENLEDVPVSVQVISGQALAEENHNSLEELTEIVPGVHVQTGANSNQLAIRGISAVDDPNVNQPVGIFIDDIYHGQSKNSNAVFLDLDHMEVLKGPQSTYFGNSAIAGAFNIVTKKPGNTLEGWARALYGQFGQYALEGALGGPITDTLGTRLAVSRNGTSEGWLDNITIGQHIPRINNEAGRLTLVYTPTDTLDATLKVEGGHHKITGTNGDYPLQYLRGTCPPPPPFTLDFIPGCQQALARGAPIGIDQNKTEGIAGQFSELSTIESVLTLNYRKWGHTFTSVSGYYKFDADQASEGSPDPTVSVVTTRIPERYHQFSEELRVASPTDGPVEYLAGVYFQSGHDDWTTDASLPVLNFVATLPGFGGIAPYLPVDDHFKFVADEKIYSVFGSLSWKMTDRLKLNAGLRGSKVEKDGAETFFPFGQAGIYGPSIRPLPTDPGSCGYPAGCEGIWEAILGVTPGTTPTASRSYKAWMPSAGIQYQLNPDAMIYASYSRGFLAGGFQAISLYLGTPDTYGSESVNAYEVGLKSKAFDDRLLLNLSLFLSNYRDLQDNVNLYDPFTKIGTNFLGNAASARSQGVELEGQWVATQNLRLTANVTYLDSRYVNYPNGSPTQLQSFCSGLDVVTFNATTQCASRYPFPVPTNRDQSGDQTPFAPRWSGRVSASYSLPLPGERRFVAALSPYFTSSFYGSGSSGDSLFLNSGYIRLDGILTLESAGERWAVDLIGKNLTDRVITTNIFQQGYKQQPRNVALQFRYRF